MLDKKSMNRLFAVIGNMAGVYVLLLIFTIFVLHVDVPTFLIGDATLRPLRRLILHFKEEYMLVEGLGPQLLKIIFVSCGLYKLFLLEITLLCSLPTIIQGLLGTQLLYNSIHQVLRIVFLKCRICTISFANMAL